MNNETPRIETNPVWERLDRLFESLMRFVDRITNDHGFMGAVMVADNFDAKQPVATVYETMAGSGDYGGHN